MNNKLVFFCLALLLGDLVWGLPPNYEDIEESEDQPENAKGKREKCYKISCFFIIFVIYLYFM